MTANIITIGDEILIGQIVDTNSAWISRRLNDAGITVNAKISVGDNKDAIRGTINAAIAMSNIVIITGGLGPTKDDITKQTLADYFDCGMVRDMETYEANRKRLEERGITYNELNKAQSLVPACCRVLPNANGTAPGMWFEREGKLLVSLPGVPCEMKALMDDYVLPLVKSHFKLNHTIHRTAIVFGLAESVLAERIAEWENALPEYIRLAYLPGFSQIRLRLSAYEVDSEENVSNEIDRQFGALEQIIPDYMVGYGDDSVVSVTSQLLTSHGATLSVAESCTGGMIAAMFTAISGASEYLSGDVVAYSNKAKVNLLGVSERTIAECGAVSRQTAEEMAERAREVFGTNYSIATTGIAGPSGGNEEKPVGMVWIAVATPEKTYSRQFMFGGKREQNIKRASVTAINFLRLILKGRADAEIVNGVL